MSTDRPTEAMTKEREELIRGWVRANIRLRPYEADELFRELDRLRAELKAWSYTGMTAEAANMAFRGMEAELSAARAEVERTKDERDSHWERARLLANDKRALRARADGLAGGVDDAVNTLAHDSRPAYCRLRERLKSLHDTYRAGNPPAPCRGSDD